MASCLQVENLSKSFGDRVLFESVSFGIDEGQRVALIAKNGAGKSTLLSILVGKEDYQEGTISFRRGIQVGLLSQTPAFNESLTVLEACFDVNNPQTSLIKEYEFLNNAIEQGKDFDEDRYQEVLSLMDEKNAWDYEVRIKQILGKLKITRFDQLISELSGGQLKRLALANVLIAEPDLLILDEPTNHLDLEMVEWLEDFLIDSKMALLMVTHDRYFLDRVCSDILEIDQCRMYHYKGNYSYYLEKRQERIEHFNAEVDRAQNLYRKELDWIRRQPQARGTKARYRVEAFDEIKRRAHQRREDKELSLQIKSQYIGSKIFEAQYISKSYGDLVILDNFYYNFSRYEKLGIVGKNGTGKSTFLRMLMGLEKPDSGVFDIGETVVFGYYSQEGMAFDENMKVIDVVRNVAEEFSIGEGKKISASQLLQKFLFAPEVQHSFVYKLSGGERRRLYLCTILMKNPNFLVLDEPTNDLDIATLNVLEEYLIGFKGCVIVVSHDRYFMDKVVDHTLAFEGNGIVKDYPGNYTDYREWKELMIAKEEEESKKNTKSKPKKESSSEKSEKNRKLTYKEQKELESIEVDLQNLEKEKTEIEQQLSSGDLSVDEITSISYRHAEILEQIEQKELRWLELNDL